MDKEEYDQQFFIASNQNATISTLYLIYLEKIQYGKSITEKQATKAANIIQKSKQTLLEHVCFY